MLAHLLAIERLIVLALWQREGSVRLATHGVAPNGIPKLWEIVLLPDSHVPLGFGLGQVAVLGQWPEYQTHGAHRHGVLKRLVALVSRYEPTAHSLEWSNSVTILAYHVSC